MNKFYLLFCLMFVFADLFSQKVERQPSDFNIVVKDGAFSAKGEISIYNLYAEDMRTLFANHASAYGDVRILEEGLLYPYCVKCIMFVKSGKFEKSNLYYRTVVELRFEDGLLAYSVNDPSILSFKGFIFSAYNKNIDKKFHSISPKNTKHKPYLVDFERSFISHLNKIFGVSKKNATVENGKRTISDLNILKRSDILSSAQGWYYDKAADEWKSKKKSIPHEYDDNFKTVQFLKVSYKNEIWFILVINSTHYYYEYPNLEVGWTSMNRCSFYIFSPAEYKAVLKRENKNTVIVTNESTVHGQFNIGALAREIKKCLNEPERKPFSCKFLFKEDDNDKIRFLLPNMSSELDIDGAYLEATRNDFYKLFINE